MECRPGEGAPSGSFFLIKDGIGADCGGRANSVCKVSSIPCHRPLTAPRARVASLCLLFHLISRVHMGVRSCPLMLHSMQSLLCGKDCTVRALPRSHERENIRGLTHFHCLSSRGGRHFVCFIQSRKELLKVWVNNWVLLVSLGKIRDLTEFAYDEKHTLMMLT